MNSFVGRGFNRDKKRISSFIFLSGASSAGGGHSFAPSPSIFVFAECR